MRYSRVIGNGYCRNKLRSGRSNNNIVRGFRLNSRRFSVSKIRVRLVSLFRFFNRLRCCYFGQSLVKRGSTRSTIYNSSGIRANYDYNEQYCCSFRSMGRSNSFYAEAIADCLEFIKRSSISSIDQIDSPLDLQR